VQVLAQPEKGNRAVTVAFSQDSIRKPSAPRGATGTGQRTRTTDQSEWSHQHPDSMVGFFRELLDFLRIFSESRPRSLPTSPLSHRARNVALRGEAQAGRAPGEAVVPEPVVVQASPRVRASRARVAAARAAAIANNAVAAAGAPGTAGEVFRRPRGLAGSMPRLGEPAGTVREPYFDDIEDVVLVDGPLEEEAPFVVPAPEELLEPEVRVPPFIARL